MTDQSTTTPQRADNLLRSLARSLTRIELWEIAAYVLLSLGSALAGSLAAVLLVPLVQPGRPLAFGGGLFEVRGGVEMQAAAFAIATMAFALLRWQAARTGARLTSRYGTLA